MRTILLLGALAAGCGGDAASPDNQCAGDVGERITPSLCNEFFDTEGAADDELREPTCRATIGFFLINRAADPDNDRTVSGTAGPLDVCFDGADLAADATGQIGFRELDLAFTERQFSLQAFIQDAWVIEPPTPDLDGELVEIEVDYDLEANGFDVELTLQSLRDFIADDPLARPEELDTGTGRTIRMYREYGDVLMFQIRFDAQERSTADVSFRWNSLRLRDGEGNDVTAALQTDSGVDW